MRFFALLFLAASLLGMGPARAAEDTRAGCDACAIQVDSLDRPLKIHGTWLFTRDDAPGNAAADLDTTSWKLVKAPGPWKHVYGDGRSFPVGWYRGSLHFAPAMVGQEVVLLLNTYMARTQVFVDGHEVYARPSAQNTSRYYSIQAIPVRFKVTKPVESVAIRVETPLMTGIYQLPLELHRYDPNDATLVFYQVWGGDARAWAAFVMVFFGFFFGLVYAKVRHAMYLTAAAACFSIFPFFALPGDWLLAMFRPEALLYLHYTGLFSSFFFYAFSQFFHRFTPKVNWIGGSIFAGLGLTIGSMAIHPDLELFQHVRAVYFLLVLACGLGAAWNYAQGMRAGRAGAGVLLVGMLAYLACGINDLLLSVGAIASISMIFAGVTVSLLTMLYVASSSFADTFVENKRLVADLTGMNENLETLVAERTRALREKTNDIQSMLQNMPQGVLTLQAGGRVHPEYSAYLETIFETADVAGREVMDLVFAQSSLGADARSQVETAIASCLGEDAMNYEFNAHLLPTEGDIQLPGGRVKSLEFTWSPIVDEQDTVDKLMLCVRDVTELRRLAEEASSQKRELEMIGEILAVSQDKFQGFIQGSLEFVDENRALIERAAQAPAPAPEVVTPLFRNMHTIKGNARTYGLRHLTHIVHEAEQAYDDLRQGRSEQFDAAALLHQLETVRHQIEEYAKINDHTLGRRANAGAGAGARGNDRWLLVERAQVARTIDELATLDREDTTRMRWAISSVEKMLRRLGAEPLSAMLEPVVASLPQLARDLGKEPPVVRVHDAEVGVREQARGLVQNLFTHLLRNSVDHGLEPPADRLAAGKPAQGQVDVAVSRQGDALHIEMHDDGRGMALARIRARAIERGLGEAGEIAAMRDEEAAQLVFLPGFSTAEQVTEVSGRGVGMDAVKGFVEAEGGTVALHFTGPATADGHRPFRIDITLPGRLAAEA